MGLTTKRSEGFPKVYSRRITASRRCLLCPPSTQLQPWPQAPCRAAAPVHRTLLCEGHAALTGEQRWSPGVCSGPCTGLRAA